MNRYIFLYSFSKIKKEDEGKTKYGCIKILMFIRENCKTPSNRDPSF